jgi:hypothetical protein
MKLLLEQKKLTIQRASGRGFWPPTVHRRNARREGAR